MGKFRILKNQDHCLIQMKSRFFWKYIKGFWSNGYELSFFRSRASKFYKLENAENTILKIKDIDRYIKKKTSKYEIIKPKTDSPLYEVLNNNEED